MKEVIIAGGTGLIGERLTQILLSMGYRVNILTRNPIISNIIDLQYYKWDILQNDIPINLIQKADFIINLSGENVGKRRWNNSFKKEILESRVKSTRLIVETLNKNPNSVKAFLNASAIGYYGLDRISPAIESDKPGNDFMAQVCIDWEAEANKLNPNIRLVISRTGIVFSSLGGALDAMAKPINSFLGAPLGLGKQIVSWIHIDDLCRSMIFALENEHVVGAFNAVSPNPATNTHITKVLAKQLKKPLFLPPVPGFVLKAILGEIADSVLASLPVKPNKLEQSGFEFNHPHLTEAIQDLYRNNK
jgi:uncharacterized protein (TIGR01777 family)